MRIVYQYDKSIIVSGKLNLDPDKQTLSINGKCVFVVGTVELANKGYGYLYCEVREPFVVM